MIRRIYIEKKRGFDADAKNLLEDLKDSLHLPRLTDVRVIDRYDIEGIDDETYDRAKREVFSAPAAETVYEEELPEDIGATFFAMSYLPGQYDQRSDSAERCIKALTPAADAAVHFARIIALGGALSDSDVAAIKKYCINPVDSREERLSKPDTLHLESAGPGPIERLEDFINLSEDELPAFKRRMGFAMSDADIRFVQRYFKEEEKRAPTITELKALDTYWSDHCRHTTFLTNLTEIQFEEGAEVIRDAFGEYLSLREEVYGVDGTPEKDICLMDIAWIGAKHLRKQGLLDDLDESDEVNACSVKVKAKVDGKEEDWLVMFKNETHNHPTEIEPFGGASTCLGGAIRDPLSGRAHVYQAMRVTGSGDPRAPVSDTLPGKLPQRKITRDAAEGYSSYGNQIGVAAGQVSEIYDDGYIAKRMELGAVIGAVPAARVRREKPVPGDVILLVGGRTGRDGCGGATGSSVARTEASVAARGADAQKGNPLIERNITRLFRRKDAARLIKKCNDFGAGGVSVAVGELADSIDAYLDLVPTKYDGLDGTELAISESQERMAVVVSKEDADAFVAYATEENLEATAIAAVTDTGRFRMFWRGETIFDLTREFLNTNGARQQASVLVAGPDFPKREANRERGGDLAGALLAKLEDVNCCGQKGLVERFDSTIGAATVLMPLGGKYQLSPAAGMAAKLPVVRGETETATLMSYGFNPEISKRSPFHGAMYAVIESVTKIVAMGGGLSNIRLSFQEYFEKMNGPANWGKPFAALLGALKVQMALEIPSIGGKDSMSGTFSSGTDGPADGSDAWIERRVPPTLVSFAVDVTDADRVLSTEFKKSGSDIVLVRTAYDQKGLPDFTAYREAMNRISLLAGQKKILAANTVGMGGLFVSLVKMAAGNKIGFAVQTAGEREDRRWTAPDCTAVILELSADEDAAELFAGVPYEKLGATTDDGKLVVKGILSVGIEDALKRWTAPLAGIFPVRPPDSGKDKETVEAIAYTERARSFPKIKAAKPKVLIPVFPGTTGETDAQRAFEKAGADVCLPVMRDLSREVFLESVNELAARIRESQIVMLAGGCAAGEEPGGSAKFMAAMFRHERVREAVADLLESRGGLMLGVCGGFQALIQLGLLPYGRITDRGESDLALTRGATGRHVSRLVRTRIASVKSPWLSGVSIGDIHTLPVSHGDGRFIAGEEQIAALVKNGQIAAQYADLAGRPSMSLDFNPGGSLFAIEAVTSPDGRVLGKMAHSERIGENLYKNVPGNYDQKIFESGALYFK